MGNGAVARKLPGAGYIQDCFARPRARIGIQPAEPLLRLAVGGQVGQVHVVITVGQKRIAQGSEHPWFVAAEVVGKNQIQSRFGLWLMFIVPLRVIPGAAVLHLFHGEAKQEHVFLPSLLRHFDGRSVACPNGQGSIHHKLHIAGSAGFIAGGRYLVGDIAGRNKPLCQRNIVLGQEQDVEPAAHGRVGVNRIRQIADEFYDELGQAVGWCRLTSEEKCARHHLHIGIFAQPVISNHNPQCVQQLPLIFVDALDVAVEDGAWVDDLSRRRFEPISEARFVLVLGCEKQFARGCVLGKWLELFELTQIRDPRIG